MAVSEDNANSFICNPDSCVAEKPQTVQALVNNNQDSDSINTLAIGNTDVTTFTEQPEKVTQASPKDSGIDVSSPYPRDLDLNDKIGCQPESTTQGSGVEKTVLPDANNMASCEAKYQNSESDDSVDNGDSNCPVAESEDASDRVDSQCPVVECRETNSCYFTEPDKSHGASASDAFESEQNTESNTADIAICNDTEPVVINDVEREDGCSVVTLETDDNGNESDDVISANLTIEKSAGWDSDEESNIKQTVVVAELLNPEGVSTTDTPAEKVLTDMSVKLKENNYHSGFNKFLAGIDTERETDSPEMESNSDINLVYEDASTERADLDAEPVEDVINVQNSIRYDMSDNMTVETAEMCKNSFTDPAFVTNKAGLTEDRIEFGTKNFAQAQIDSETLPNVTSVTDGNMCVNVIPGHIDSVCSESRSASLENSQSPMSCSKTDLTGVASAFKGSSPEFTLNTLIARSASCEDQSVIVDVTTVSDDECSENDKQFKLEEISNQTASSTVLQTDLNDSYFMTTSITSDNVAMGSPARPGHGGCFVSPLNVPAPMPDTLTSDLNSFVNTWGTDLYHSDSDDSEFETGHSQFTFRNASEVETISNYTDLEGVAQPGEECVPQEDKEDVFIPPVNGGPYMLIDPSGNIVTQPNGTQVWPSGTNYLQEFHKYVQQRTPPSDAKPVAKKGMKRKNSDQLQSAAKHRKNSFSADFDDDELTSSEISYGFDESRCKQCGKFCPQDISAEAINSLIFGEKRKPLVCESCQERSRASRFVKGFITSQRKVVRLRRKIYRLIQIIFPDLECSCYINMDSAQLDVLMDQIVQVLSDKKPKRTRLHAIPVEDIYYDAKVLLCKQPRACLTHLKRKVIKFIGALLPELPLSGIRIEAVDELLDMVIKANKS